MKRLTIFIILISMFCGTFAQEYSPFSEEEIKETKKINPDMSTEEAINYLKGVIKDD